jgi:hypothetical protein
MVNIILTTKQLNLITEREQLNESLLSLENGLMLAGFVPVIGEVADIALICYYLYKGEKLYAALMLIALIPTVGDFIAKPIIKFFKGSKAGTVAMKQGGVKLTQYLTKHPEAAAKFTSLGKYVKSPAVEKTVQGISKISPRLGSKLTSGLGEITGVGGALGGLTSGAKEVMAGGKFARGLKDYFQGERLTKYFAKHGVLPEKGIQKWWLNVQARGDRKDAFRKFIITNNLLASFGIPSLTTFEKKLSDDEEFRKKVADDPKMSDYIAQNYESNSKSNKESDDSDSDSKPSEETKSKSNPFGDMLRNILTGSLSRIVA